MPSVRGQLSAGTGPHLGLVMPSILPNCKSYPELIIKSCKLTRKGVAPNYCTRQDQRQHPHKSATPLTVHTGLPVEALLTVPTTPRHVKCKRRLLRLSLTAQRLPIIRLCKRQTVTCHVSGRGSGHSPRSDARLRRPGPNCMRLGRRANKYAVDNSSMPPYSLDATAVQPRRVGDTRECT